MKKSLLVIASLIGFGTNSFAQLTKADSLKGAMTLVQKDTVAWIYSGQLNLGATQGFLHNWASGGEIISVQANGIFAGNLTHINHNKVWSNDLLLAYGLNYVYSNMFVPRKVDDRIDFTSKYGVGLKKCQNWFITGLMNFRTQFTKGYDYSLNDWRKMPVSNRLSPAYLTLAAGMEYKTNDFTLFFSPAALRFTFANSYYTTLNPEGAFGIAYGKTSRTELGAYLSARYQKQLSPKVTYRGRLDLYSNYLAKDEVLNNVVVKKDNPGNIDVMFDNYLGFKLTKAVSVALGVTLIYDNDMPYRKTYIDPNSQLEVTKDEPGNNLGWSQINQVFNIGLQYKF